MNVLIRTLLFTVLVPGTVTVAVPRLLLPSGANFTLNGSGILGTLLIVLGATAYVRCVWNFTFSGKGTPAPIDPPKTLVSRGLYRIVRNPMYIGIGCILLGESVAFSSYVLLWYAVGFLVFAHLFVLLYEEPALTKKFGPSYEEYRKTVPRWTPRLLPRRRK